MPKTSPVQRLRVLNSLLSVIHASDPEKAIEIRKAVDFYIDELQSVESESMQVSKFAQDILDIHVEGKKRQGLCFWSLDDADSEPLWMRASFLERLESLRHYRTSTVVVFGLRETVGGHQKYWTQKMETEFRYRRDYLETVAAEWQPDGYQLNLIYI